MPCTCNPPELYRAYTDVQDELYSSEEQYQGELPTGHNNYSRKPTIRRTDVLNVPKTWVLLR